MISPVEERRGEENALCKEKSSERMYGDKVFD